AITADAFNNLSDAGSSLITLLGFKIAGQKPDPDHPFGHGRVEYIAGLFVSLAIVMMGVELVKISFDKIRYPESTSFSYLIVGILIASIVVKLYMAYYNHSIGKKISSATMIATATDSLSDTLSTLVVLISTLVSQFTSFHIDGYCGILVGLFILYAGFNAAKDTINPLLGQPPAKEFVEKIEEIVMSYDLIIGIHDLVVHDYGPGRVMISVHAEVPADGDLLEIHDVIDTIEHHLNQTLHCESVIHMDPIMRNNEEVDFLKNSLKNMLSEMDCTLKFHDFRIVKGPTHTNVLFDVVVPFHFSMTDTEIKSSLQDSFSLLDDKYMLVIDVDKSYVSG
ncbi:MAG: cation diffusion facilitator family transporter, partial [Eubacteriales bacterium]